MDKLIKGLGMLGDVMENKGDMDVTSLLTDAFMSKNTDFGSLKDFAMKAGLKAITNADFDSLNLDTLDTAVKTFTKFDGWQDMLAAAVEDNDIVGTIKSFF